MRRPLIPLVLFVILAAGMLPPATVAATPDPAAVRRVLALLEETRLLQQELAALRALAARSGNGGPAGPGGNGDAG